MHNMMLTGQLKEERQALH